jgi:hypothetical protein
MSLVVTQASSIAIRSVEPRRLQRLNQFDVAVESLDAETGLAEGWPTAWRCSPARYSDGAAAASEPTHALLACVTRLNGGEPSRRLFPLTVPLFLDPCRRRPPRLDGADRLDSATPARGSWSLRADLGRRLVDAQALEVEVPQLGWRRGVRRITTPVHGTDEPLPIARQGQPPLADGLPIPWERC